MDKKITVFHRNAKCGFSINKVSQTFLRYIDNKEEYYVPRSDSSLCSIFKNIYFVRRHRNKKGINHITGDIHYCVLGLLGCKTILTIHDTVSIDYYKTSWLKRTINILLWYRIPLLLADKIVCISESTRASIKRFTKRDDIIVIYNASDDRLSFHPRQSINLSTCNKPTILTIGTKPNKNLIRTIEALKNIPCRLRIVGKLTNEIINALERCKIDYSNVFNLTDSEIEEEYVNCDIVSFVSLYEGFGMPIIEANRVGRPVICSDIPILKEIASDAALLVSPYDVNSIREGFEHLIINKQLQEDLIEKGQKNIVRFELSSIVLQWRQLYMSTK